ncbi:hypothetical protein QYM36_008027 [Artemia franciscana]|uniref:Reverse transcriptase domain-containing protein n=1 Tax=Artemia franciscana TaxID=6661 RepID=A0AA88LDF8_ARTSF|nr:hypothetical protein QYM36_008027 [Artemia franciscana]
MTPPSASEILNAIKRLKNSKSPGEYGLPPEIYKASPHVVAQQLETLFSLIWDKKIFPSDWKVSVIIQVFKKGYKYDSHNYRRISLMDMATKVFAMILLKRFEEARDERTRENQCEFRRERGSIVRLLGEETESFSVESGVKQGCILSPVLFNYCINWILERALSSFDGVVMGLGINGSDLYCADDIDALTADPATA